MLQTERHPHSQAKDGDSCMLHVCTLRVYAWFWVHIYALRASMHQ